MMDLWHGEIRGGGYWFDSKDQRYHQALFHQNLPMKCKVICISAKATFMFQIMFKSEELIQLES